MEGLPEWQNSDVVKEDVGIEEVQALLGSIAECSAADDLGVRLKQLVRVLSRIESIEESGSVVLHAHRALIMDRGFISFVFDTYMSALPKKVLRILEKILNRCQLLSEEILPFLLEKSLACCSSAEDPAMVLERIANMLEKVQDSEDKRRTTVEGRRCLLRDHPFIGIILETYWNPASPQEVVDECMRIIGYYHILIDEMVLLILEKSLGCCSCTEDLAEVLNRTAALLERIVLTEGRRMKISDVPKYAIHDHPFIGFILETFMNPEVPRYVLRECAEIICLCQALNDDILPLLQEKLLYERMALVITQEIETGEVKKTHLRDNGRGSGPVIVSLFKILSSRQCQSNFPVIVPILVETNVFEMVVNCCVYPDFWTQCLALELAYTFTTMIDDAKLLETVFEKAVVCDPQITGHNLRRYTTALRIINLCFEKNGAYVAQSIVDEHPEFMACMVLLITSKFGDGSAAYFENEALTLIGNLCTTEAGAILMLKLNLIELICAVDENFGFFNVTSTEKIIIDKDSLDIVSSIICTLLSANQPEIIARFMEHDLIPKICDVLRGGQLERRLKLLEVFRVLISMNDERIYSILVENGLILGLVDLLSVGNTNNVALAVTHLLLEIAGKNATAKEHMISLDVADTLEGLIESDPNIELNDVCMMLIGVLSDV